MQDYMASFASYFDWKNDFLFVSKPFNTFWHLNPCLFDHEDSKVHRLYFDKWYELTLRLHIHQTIDKGIHDIMDKERKKWRVIIRKIMGVIFFLSKQNLFFEAIVKSLTQKNKVTTFLKL